MKVDPLNCPKAISTLLLPMTVFKGMTPSEVIEFIKAWGIPLKEEPSERVRNVQG